MKDERPLVADLPELEVVVVETPPTPEKPAHVDDAAWRRGLVDVPSDNQPWRSYAPNIPVNTTIPRGQAN